MIALRPTPRAEMERRAAEALAARRPVSREPQRPPARNIASILTLGDSTYFNFRGRAFGVPPLPWKLGERLLALYLRAVDAANAMRHGASHGRTDHERMREYYAALGELSPLLWSLCVPVSRFPRLTKFLRAIGVYRNPFLGATERELLDLADFFSQRRTRSGVSFPTATDLLARATSSTNS